ncbi:MAG: DCC1-like thiol-disulfide oxidoreductase family protein [Pseudomonadota bacterium]
MNETATNKPDIWFVYDGECPVCQLGVSLFKVRQSVGTLHTVDARTEKDHPVMQEVNAARLNLDTGMVIKYLGQLYQGEDALAVMAKIGADEGLFNKMNRTLFQSRTRVNLCYPPMRFARNVALAFKGVGKIRNLES